MNILVPLSLFGWVVVSALLFSALPGRRAVIASVIGGTLLLPVSGYSFPGFPDYTKYTAISLGLLAGILCFDAGRIRELRLRWFDAPVLVAVTSPFLTAMSNDLGVYDGVSSVFGRAVDFGIPYFAGRLYFRNLADLRELAVGIVLGGLAYVPLCLLEVRFSPQLHTWVYGFHQHAFIQTRRFGGFRPTVFMNHGLMVSLWMASATVCAVWLWLRGGLRDLLRVPMWLLTLALIVTTILCKSVGASVLLVVGVSAAVLATVVPVRWILVGMLLLPVVHASYRLVDHTAGSDLVEVTRNTIGDVSAGSLRYRFRSENALMDHALERPVLGWGGWGRSRPPNSENADVVTDGWWVIVLGENGLVGLAALMSSYLLPAWLLAANLPGGPWRGPALASAVALAVVVVIFMIDSLFNAMPNQAYLLAAGALGAAPALCRALARAERRAAMRRSLAGGPAGVAPGTPALRPTKARR